MGQPSPSNVGLLRTEYIGAAELTRGSEISQYPEEEKVSHDSLSSDERKGNSLNSVTRTRLRPLRHGGSGAFADQFAVRSESDKSLR